MPVPDFSLQEEFLLLCLNDDTGRFETMFLGYGLNAAGLGELLLADRLRLENDKVKVADATPTGDEVLDTALTRLAMSKRIRALSWWVWRLYKQPATAQEILVPRLIRRGILTQREGKVLWVFPRDEYPTVDGTHEQQMRRQIGDAILREGSFDDRTAILIALLSAAGVLRFVLRGLDWQQRRKCLRRVKRIQESSPLASALGQALAYCVAAASG
jgi:hypothetical protein